MKQDGYYQYPLGGAVIHGKGGFTTVMVGGASVLLATQAGAALSTVANTASITAFTTPFVPPTIPKKMMTVGCVVNFRASGEYRTTGTPTLALVCKLDDATSGGSPNLGGFQITTLNTLTTAWCAEFGFIVETVGVGGTACTMARPCMFGGAGVNAVPRLVDSTYSGITVATTLNHTVEMAVTWGAADPLNSITLQAYELTISYPITAN